jgi:hypothetical protein
MQGELKNNDTDDDMKTRRQVWGHFQMFENLN